MKTMKMKTKYEAGRSMVEMLGVLAVVGVLSVGAIAGYNYAMRSHRANEMINAVSTLYTTGLSQKGGDGTGELDYVTTVGELPAGAKGLAYNDDTTVTLDIADTNDCTTVKSKLGDKVVEGDCGTLDAESGAYTLVVAMGEVKGENEDIKSSPYYKANCSESNGPCIGDGWYCDFSCYCNNGATNPPNCNDSFAVVKCGGDAADNGFTDTYLCSGEFVSCSSNFCYCNDPSEEYPNCTKKAKCLENGTCYPPHEGSDELYCFDRTKTPPDCE